MGHSFDLERFISAQDSVFDEVLSELRNGRKESHWMWFIFPQIKGLGSSAMAQKYAIFSRAEAEEYLAHSILGPRLIQCTQVVNQVGGRTAEEIFGPVDAVKFRSSMTLFAEVTSDLTVFREALGKYFEGEPDRLTLHGLGSDK